MRRANRLPIAGTGFLALALAAVVYLVAELLFDEAIAAVLSALLTLLMAWFWFGLPIADRERRARARNSGAGR